MHWRLVWAGVLIAGSLSAQSPLLRTKLMPVVPDGLSPTLGVRLDSLRTTPGGVFYDDLTLGNGAVVAVGDSIAVRFVGFLANGTVVTESRTEPIRFRVGAGHVIPGWDEGVLGMRVGGRRQLIIPPELGYGEKASGPIPANSTLVFDIIIVDRY